MQKLLTQLRQRPGQLIVLAGLCSTVVAMLLAAIRAPVPTFHDEFSYLLAADTFANGRLANPPHPLWPHFETFHVIHQPSYVSKYQPAQGLMLALGQRLGHPIKGACITTGLATLAVCWMLAAWLPPRWLLIAAGIMILHPSLQLVWGQSYWGGAVPLIGASLLFGGLRRLSFDWSASAATALAGGIILLAASRPFEGAVAAVCAGFGLVALTVQRRPVSFRRLCTRVMAPAGALLFAAAMLGTGYNLATTGNALRIPYQVHEATYGWCPLFLWQRPKAPPPYRHNELSSYHRAVAEQTQRLKSDWPTLLVDKLRVLQESTIFFLGCSLLLAMPGAFWAVRRRDLRFTTISLCALVLAALSTPWGMSHYFAPAAPLIFLLAMFSMRYLRAALRGAPGGARCVVPIILIAQLVWFFGSVGVTYCRPQDGWQWQRARLVNRLRAEPGRDLVFVQYDGGHDLNEEWVYNRADIDGAEIVWAREISPQSDWQLMQYFLDRRIWLLHADQRPVRLEPYAIARVPTGRRGEEAATRESQPGKIVQRATNKEKTK